MWRPGAARGCRPTRNRNSKCKSGTRCGAGSRILGFLDRFVAMHGASACVQANRGGRVKGRCGDPDRRAGVIRLVAACATARRDAEPVLGPSDFSTAPRCMHSASACVQATRGGRVKGRCGDPDRRAGVIRLGPAFRSVDWRWEERRRRGVVPLPSDVEYRCYSGVAACEGVDVVCASCVSARASICVFLHLCARVCMRDHACVMCMYL